MKIRYDYTITGSFVVDYSDDDLKELLSLEDTDDTPSILGEAELSDLADVEKTNGYDLILDNTDNREVTLNVSQVME